MWKFNEQNLCPKCGQHATTHHEPRTDTMKRRCLRCGYTWRESPLDEPSPTVAERPGRPKAEA